MVGCDMHIPPIKSHIVVASSLTLFTGFLHHSPKKLGTDIPDLKVPNQVIEKSWKNSPVLCDQFLDEDMGRFWHPLSSAGERGMTSGER